MDDQQRARERLAKECLNEAKAMEKRAKNDRETGDSIQEAIDNDQGVTPDEPQDVAAGLLNDADLAETTAKLLRRAHAALRAAPEVGDSHVVLQRVDVKRLLVPVEPTDEMKRAGTAHVSNPYGLARDVWAAMLVARPQESKE